MYLVLMLLLFSNVSLYAGKIDLHDMHVDFQHSMNTHPDHDIPFAMQNFRWQKAQRLYEKHILQALQYADAVRIPKIIHHVWLGSSLPEYAQHFRQTWITQHPDWTFVLWTDHPESEYGTVVLQSFQELQEYLKRPDREQFVQVHMGNLNFENMHAYRNVAKNYGEKSDIIRYEILYNIGGLYVDTDFECLMSFDEFHYCCDFYTGVSHTKEFVLYNGLIASVARHAIMRQSIDHLKNRRHTCDSLTYSGPHYFTECFFRAQIDDSDLVVPFPVTFFYPWPHHFRKNVQKAKTWVRPESFAIHHWKVSWKK